MSVATKPAELVPTPVNSRSIRAALKAAGLLHLIDRVSTGTNYAHLHIAWEAQRPDGSTPSDAAAEQVAETIRPLWTDGAERVHVLYSGKVMVKRAGYWRTLPDTVAGRAELIRRERERAAQLLTWLEAAPEGSFLHATDRKHRWISVEYAPELNHPQHSFKPKFRHDDHGQRYSALEVYLHKANPA